MSEEIETGDLLKNNTTNSTGIVLEANKFSIMIKIISENDDMCFETYSRKVLDKLIRKKAIFHQKCKRK